MLIICDSLVFRVTAPLSLWHFSCSLSFFLHRPLRRTARLTLEGSWVALSIEGCGRQILTKVHESPPQMPMQSQL
jgi:hypothetical protein